MTERKVLKILGSLVGLALASMAGPVLAQQSASIATGAGVLDIFATRTVEVRLINDAPVEGFVLAIGYTPAAAVSVSNVSVNGTATSSAGAELVVPEIFDAEGGFTLGVVLDAGSPFDGQTIAAGATAKAIAKFDVTADNPSFAESSVTFDFADDTFNEPILNNIIVQGGESFGIGSATSGAPVTGTPGVLELGIVQPDSIRFQNTTIPVNGNGSARILLSNASGPVQGFVTAITHDEGVNLVAINLTGTVSASVGAEFVQPAVFANGGTLGVVLDFISPFDGQTIPVGTDNHIANYVYSCDDHPTAPAEPDVHSASFVDGVLGSPVLDNVIVVAGLSLTPTKNNGTLTCAVRPADDGEFHLGACGGGAAHGFPGSRVSVELRYVDPTDNWQGLSAALCMPEGNGGVLSFVAGSFTIEGTIFEAVGAEFVIANVDDVGNEMTIGILLDALPPFDDQTVPQTLDPLAVGCFEVDISASAGCGACYAIEFCDGVDAGMQVPVENLAVIDFQSVDVGTLIGTELCIDSLPEFRRGDCNGDNRHNIADAAAILGKQFQGFEVGCDDACDANDDGKINLADTVFMLNYLFKSGAAPKAPFPGLGQDPTEDDLGCEEGSNPCD